MTSPARSSLQELSNGAKWEIPKIWGRNCKIGKRPGAKGSFHPFAASPLRIREKGEPSPVGKKGEEGRREKKKRKEKKKKEKKKKKKGKKKRRRRRKGEEEEGRKGRKGREEKKKREKKMPDKQVLS
ncbi:unnamed protein product [Victoria cruziana]